MAYRLTQIEADLLLVMFQLRYLSTKQIQKTWYRERPVLSVGRRLRKLRSAGWIGSTSLQRGVEGLAWRLTAEGLRKLKQVRDAEVWMYEDQSFFADDHAPYLDSTGTFGNDERPLYLSPPNLEFLPSSFRPEMRLW